MNHQTNIQKDKEILILKT